MKKFEVLPVVEKFVSMKKKGAIYLGLCPFHNERTPSFTVHPVKNIFKCFGCGKGGDAIEFIERHLSFNFKETVEWLNNFTGNSFTHTEVKEHRRLVQLPGIIDIKIETSGTGNLKEFIKSIGVDVDQIFEDYLISSLPGNWSLFWYVDIQGKIRSGKYMKYNENGRRDKESITSWEHKRRDHKGEVYKDFNFVQCFFGEHLLSKDVRKPVAIVESEKTALIASIFIDKYIWLACGSKNGLSRSKCEVLANRSVTLFPDLGAFDLWSEKAKEFGFNISDHLERIATDDQRENGYDLADFLLI